MLGKYQRITDDDKPEELGVELSENPVNTINNVKIIATGEPLIEVEEFTIKVMYKESTHIVKELNENSTVLQLKQILEPVFQIPQERQRFIFAGKQLKPDNKSLSSFKVLSNSSIHLFPLPAPTPPTAVPMTGSSVPIGVTGNPLIGDQGVAQDAVHSPIHFDPVIAQTSKEVKIWCLLLLFLSGMTLFNNLSYMSGSGKFGSGTLDTLVTFADTICSAGGIYVANLGVTSLRTLDITDVRKYVQWLSVLAVCCVAMRLAWVVDVILQVQHAVDHAKHDPTDTSNTDNTGDDAQQAGVQKLDDRLVVNFAIQASIVALICIMAWGNCVLRARRLQTTVQNFDAAMQV